MVRCFVLIFSISDSFLASGRLTGGNNKIDYHIHHQTRVTRRKTVSISKKNTLLKTINVRTRIIEHV